MDSGFRRKDGRGGGIYANLRANGRRGGDVDSGFRRKDGGGPSGRGRGFRLSPERRGWRRLRRLVGRRTPGRGRGFRLSPERRGWRTPGRGRGFRLSPERRGWAIREGTWIRAFAGKTEGVAALRFSPARCFVVLYRSRELRPQRFVHMGHTEHCLFVEGPSRNLKPDGQAFGV